VTAGRTDMTANLPALRWQDDPVMVCWYLTGTWPDQWQQDAMRASARRNHSRIRHEPLRHKSRKPRSREC
jgi:hypothetical protein